METAALPAVLPPQWVRIFHIGDEEEVRRNARRRGDLNYLHHDAEAARAEGYFGIIAPGLMVADLVAEGIVESVNGATLRSFSMRGKEPVYPNSELTVVYSIAWRRGLLVKLEIAIKSNGVLAMEGVCILLLPKRYKLPKLSLVASAA